MNEVDNLINDINKNIPCNKFTIEDEDDFVILGKINAVLDKLQIINNLIKDSDLKSNDALKNSIMALNDAQQALEESIAAVDSANTALSTGNMALETANASKAESAEAKQTAYDAYVDAYNATRYALEALNKKIGTFIYDYNNNYLNTAKFVGSESINVDMAEGQPNTFTFRVDQTIIQQLTSLSERLNLLENNINDFEIALSNKADKNYVDDNLALKANTQYVNQLVENKQDKLTAGANITIENNVISASGGGILSTNYDLSRVSEREKLSKDLANLIRNGKFYGALLNFDSIFQYGTNAGADIFYDTNQILQISEGTDKRRIGKIFFKSANIDGDTLKSVIKMKSDNYVFKLPLIPSPNFILECNILEYYNTHIRIGQSYENNHQKTSIIVFYLK